MRAVERGQAGRERRESVVVAAAGRDIVDQPVEGDVAVALQRLRDVFQAFGDADRIDQHEAGLCLGVRRHLAHFGVMVRAPRPFICSK